MAIQRVQCPACSTALNIPAAMAQVKCPACGCLFNPNQPQAAGSVNAPKAAAGQAKPGPQQKRESEGESQGTNQQTIIIASVAGGAMLLISFVGFILFLVNRTPPAPPPAPVVETVANLAAKPIEYREVNLPESTRRSIYDEYRKMAKTTVEKPLILPDGTRVRQRLEDMLEKTHDRELTHFALLHDITEEDVRQIIAEGDAKNWDPTPRSNAVRDGERVHPEEMSEGWKGK